MKIEDLEKLLQKQEVFSDKELREDLEKLIVHQYGNEVTLVPSDLSFYTYRYLICNGLSPYSVLISALDIDTFHHQYLLEKQEQIIKLALQHNANLNKISYFSNFSSIKLLTLLIKYGLDKNKAAHLIMSFNINNYDYGSNKNVVDIFIERELIDALLSQGFDIKDFDQLPDNLAYATYEYLLEKGLRPDVLLKTVVAIPTTRNSDGIMIHDTNLLEKKEKLLDLLLAYNPDLSIITHLPSIPSVSFIERLIDNGLSPDNALKMVLNINSNSYNNSSGYVCDQYIEKFKQELVNVLLEKGADINQVINQMIIFREQFNMLELLFNNMDNLLNRTSNPLTPNNFLKVVLKSEVGIHVYYTDYRYITSLKKIELQGILIQEALARGADVNKIEQEIYKNIEELFYNHKEVILKYFSPNTLLFWVSYLSAKEDYDYNYDKPKDESQTKNSELILEIAKFAIDNGADVNVINNGQTPLDIAQDLGLIDLLKNHGAECMNINIQEIVEAGLELSLLKPSMIIEQKYKNLYATKSEEAKMPYITHHIWLTSKDKPKEIRGQDLKIIFGTKDTFAKAPVSWEHIVWTNDKSLIPVSVKKLEDHGIKVMSIYEYRDKLNSFNLIEGLITKQKWGMASDALRYSLIENFGGVYSDINFIFNRDNTDEAHKYNFFTITHWIHYIDNFFFGASAHHPVVAKMVYLVERNLVNSPKYLSYINQDQRLFTDKATANPAFLAYYKEANKNGNIDVAYPMTQLDQLITNKDRLIIPLDKDSNEYILAIDKCPDEKIYLDFLIYINNHEICGAEILNIGHDSKDGNTWLY